MSRIPGTAVATTSRVPDAHQAPGDPVQAPVVEVLEEGVVGREGPDRQSGPHLDVLVGEGGHAEARRQPRFAFDLDDQHAQTRARGRGGQGGGDGRLPHPALARNDHDSGGGAELRELHAPNATRGLRGLRMAGAVALVARERGRPADRFGRRCRADQPGASGQARHLGGAGRRAPRPADRRAGEERDRGRERRSTARCW